MPTPAGDDEDGADGAAALGGGSARVQVLLPSAVAPPPPPQLCAQRSTTNHAPLRVGTASSAGVLYMLSLTDRARSFVSVQNLGFAMRKDSVSMVKKGGSGRSVAAKKGAKKAEGWVKAEKAQASKLGDGFQDDDGDVF
jgi:hypothetical protein